MRRVSSIVLFVIGGLCVMMQVMVAFVAAPSKDDHIFPALLSFAGVAALFLVPATWLSQGQRWRELGLTIFISAFVISASTASLIYFPDEPGVRPDLSPLLPHLDLAQGFANLAVTLITGLLLSIFGDDDPLVSAQDARNFARLLRDGTAEFATAMRSAWRAVLRK